MRILFCGDIVGRSGREAVISALPDLRRRLELDFVIANGENAAAGHGITRKICEELYGAGVDVVTSGNHIWDQAEIISYIGSEPRLLRPLNYPSKTPGQGLGLYRLRNNKTILVANVMGQLFMPPVDDPFAALEAALEPYPLGRAADAIVVDFHAEATSEKMAAAHFLDGRVSLLVGTHTHIPTADGQILPHGTGYQSDAGMCGDYNSVIGVEKNISIGRFRRKYTAERMRPADGPGTVCGVLLETDPESGLARALQPVRLGGRLVEAMPAASGSRV